MYVCVYHELHKEYTRCTVDDSMLCVIIFSTASGQGEGGVHGEGIRGGRMAEHTLCSKMVYLSHNHKCIPRLVKGLASETIVYFFF